MHRACSAGIRSARSSTTRTGDAPPCRTNGRSDRDRPPARCRCRPRWRRIARASDERALRALAGDRDRLAAGGPDLVVGGDRELQDHMRALVARGGNGRRDRARPRSAPRPTSTTMPAARSVHGPAPRPPGWDPRSPTPRARCRRRSPHRRKAASCHNASRARASRRASHPAPHRRPAAAPRARHAAGRRAGSSRGRR